MGHNTNLNLDLGNMPPAGWMTIISLVAILLGKMFDIGWLFWLGIIAIALLIVAFIISLFV